MAKKTKSPRKKKPTAAPPRRFLNRELSWLEFNQRVLAEARDESTPVLERLKFLAITASNLDEFFMVRVGGLQLLDGAGAQKPDAAGMTPREQLDAISIRTHEIMADQYQCYLHSIEPELRECGIRRPALDALSEWQATFLTQMFEDEIHPVLSPLAVSDDTDCPLLPSFRLHCCLRLEADEPDEPSRFAIINLGESLGRFITIPAENSYEYVLLEDVVELFVERFCPGEPVLECIPFRVVRNADLSVQEDLAGDLMSEMQEVLDARKTSGCVRLEIDERASDELVTFLGSTLEIDESFIFSLPGPIDLSALMALTDLSGYSNLQFERVSPCQSPEIDPTESLFDTLTENDVLLYHPFESFDPVVRLVEESAEDPDVLAIKQILYRTSRNSPVVKALKRAAQAGKSVTAVVELKARFDEARNIEWARDLEHAGVQVFYGVKGLKTHAKCTVVVRREPTGVQKYVHFGTGNYNEVTARLYTDASLMTSDPELGADATSFFHAITGYSEPPEFLHIDAAPISLRDRVIEMISVETERARAGQTARIMAKLNSLVDPQIIEALYEASQAGVRIELNIRGICCLIPGLKGLSENIRVVSIVDRFLEHSRLLFFHHGGDERVFISSADWMQRNLDRRIELLVPVLNPRCRKRLIGILELCLADNTKSHELQSDGHYQRQPVGRDGTSVHSQIQLLEMAQEAERNASPRRQLVFEPHRAASQGDDDDA